jgi:KipI family sensor histidine kinase inhibitor
MFTLQERPIEGIVELVPTYRSLAIHYNPLIMTFRELQARLNLLMENTGTITLPAARLMEIPVIYGGDYGPDLAFVAGYLGRSSAEVVSLHTSVDYLVYMLGFTPGFPYLGGMDERLAVPRLDQPRMNIPRGSVGIAGKQTGIYPVNSPGGWRLIGRTPLKLYDPSRENPVLLRAGDYLRFRSIDEEEYGKLEG